MRCVALVGDGRMGTVLEGLCRADGIAVAGMVGPAHFPRLSGIPDIAAAECALDFSYPGNLEPMLEDAARLSLPLVVGTTGLSPAQEEAIREAARVLPIVRAENFSMGVTVMLRLARQAAEALSEYDAELVETHHRMKEDAPSGTAKALLRAVDPEGAHPLVYGREGRPGKRGREIGVHSLRGGTVAGEHSLRFFGPMEELELRHRADSREVFAQGALRAAAFAAKAAPGYYTMEDVLFG